MAKHHSPFVLERRKFLASAAVFTAAGFIPRSALVLAEPCRLKMGKFDVTFVSDEQFITPWTVIAPDAPPEELRKFLSLQVSGDTVAVEVNLAVLRSDREVILVDAGAEQGFQSTAGRLIENLELARITADMVTRIAFSHAHPDDFWGALTNDGGIRFSNAVYGIAEVEWNFWMDADPLTKVPTDMAPFVRGAQRHLTAVKVRLLMFRPGQELVSGQAVVDASGHTPGHVAFEIAGNISQL